jgi:antirestriction protein ArdC
MEEQANVYEKITNSIIEAIEAGSGKFEMPWHTFSLLPSNAKNHRQYRGINVLALSAVASRRGFKTNLWSTYQQWQDLGAQVRKGEKSATVVFWKFYGEEHQTDDVGDETSENKTGSRCFARAYNVFNADQVDGFTIPELPQLADAERIERAEVFFHNTGAAVIEKGGRACYDSQADEIHMPPFALFKKADYYYSILGHETIHLTGHPSRCNRQLRDRFGSESYATEELIAELGSAFLSAELELETEPRRDHAPYIQSWLKVLRNDKRAIFTAATKAQQAVDWLFRQIPRRDETAA